MSGARPRTKRHFVTFEPWQVVVVPFPFSETAGSKRRPALVVSRHSFNDRCLVRMKLFTLDSSLIVRHIGRLGEADLQRVKENLTRCLAV